MAWDWLKDNNDEPNEFKPIDARGLLDGKEYHDYWTTKLHNGLANVPKSLLGAVESIPAMAARTRPVVMQELENDLDGTGLMDSDADKEALGDVENQIKGTTAPIWEGARLGVKAAKDALPDANWESNVDESQLSYPKKIGGMILENAPLMAAQLGASIINPALGVALMAGSIAGDAYNDLTEKGVDPLTAGQAGWLDAAAQAPLEGVGEMGWLKAFRELGTEGAAKLMGKAFVKEGLTEAVQEFPDETIPYIAEHGSLDGFDWGQLASNAVDAGVVGGIYGGGFAGIGRAINGKAQAPQQETGQDSAGVDNGNGDTPSSSPAIHAMNRLVNELGIDPKAASGIVGGLMLESGGNTTDISTTAENPESGAYGIGQWTGPRKAELMAFAEETGGDPNDLDTQISFLIHELKGSENGALQEIIKAQSTDEAGRLADKFYERSEGTDEIRNQKAANAQKIYDMFMNGGADPNVVYNGGKRGGSSVPNPKSAEDFLKDLEETLPADTDEDVEKLNAIRKAIQGKNKKAQEELAAQYGWGENASETAQDASEPNTQSVADNAATGRMTQSVTHPMAIPQGRGNSISGTKSIKSDRGMYQPSGRVEGGNKSVYTPKKPKGMQYTPQGNVQAGSNEGGMTAVQPNVAPVIPAPSSIKEPASNASTSLPSAEPQIYTPRKVNGIADRQRRDRQARGNTVSAAAQDRINKALKNSRLRQVVKQAFVDGDKDALNRLGAMQINQDVLQAVKNDVLNEYHKTEPVVPPKVIPAQEPYTPRYGSRDEAMRLPYERNNENTRGDIAIGGGDGVISSQRASTPREAVRLDNKARKNREANENRAYDIGEAPSPKEQKKAAIARARQEKRDAKNTYFNKYEPAPYATRYANRDKVMQGFRNINENMSGNEARKDRVTGITSSGNNGDASNQNRAGSRDMSAYKNQNRLSVSMPSRDRQGIGEDMRNRQQNRNAYEPDTKSRLEKPTIFAKENTNENYKENQQVHRSEENKNDNAKPEQSKPSESKDRETPEGKNPVKKAPPKETPSSDKKEEPTKAGAQNTENATPKVESKEHSKKGNGVEQDKPVGTTEPPKKSEDAKPKDEIGKDNAAIKDAKKICDDAIREVDAIADEFTKAVKSNPDSLPDASNFVEKLRAVLDRAKAETRAIKTNTSETAEKIHKIWLEVNDHILQKVDEADKLFADFYSRKSYIPEHDIPMVEEFARKLYKCLNKFANSSGNMQSFVEAVREMKALESQINGMTADKAVRRALEDSYAAHMYHIYRMYFEHKTVEPRKSDTEYSMEDVRILAKKKESKKTVEEDEKALALLGQDLYDRAYKPIADYLRIVGDASRGDAFESAVLFAKMMESFHKNYGIWFPIPHLVKAVARRGKTFTILGTFSPNANAFILSKFSNGEVFAHEATHMYESMLRTFSTLTNEDVDKYFSGDKKKAREAIEKIRADLKAIDEWTSYSKEHLQEYEGTILYTEFRKHANAVKRGADIGERTWRTERLARGFTQYLGEGNRAPTKELEGVFARIKQWVLDAYGAIKNLTNGKLPPDMEKFYQSMISGDTEYFKNMANRGKSATVRTDDGKEFKVSYKIVPAETLIASNTADFGKNENYPAKLQPRDRDRVSMKEQVDDMARNLRPEDLAESRSVNQGAPLVNQDNVVENGNGRTMAITRAYTTDGDAYKASSQKYKQYLMEHAEEYGYTREEVEAMQNPVLVRQRDASSDSLQDSIIHSTEGGMKMSASQQAKVDAEKISPKTLSLYDYDGTGDLTKRSNNDFVVSALNEIADKSERDVVFNKDGTPSKAGIERVKSALAAYAYGDNSLLERISESTDTEDQNIVKAFSAAAPRVAAIKAKLDKGGASKDYDLSSLLSDVLDFYFKCKNSGKSIKFALNETSLFGDDSWLASVGGKDLARFIADNTRRPKAISDAIVRMTKYIDGANEPSDALFSGTKMRLDEIVRTSIGLNASKFIPASKPNARKYKHTIQPKENTWDSMPATQQKACIKLMDANGGHYDSKTKSFGFIDEKARDAALNVLEAYLSADSKASAKIAIIPTANAEVISNSRMKSMRLARRKPDRISIHGKTDTLLTGRGWNGSPADFDHFDLAFIGTGEGNTAHGWGIYFARDVTYKGDADWGRKVSEGYKKRYGGADGKLYYAAIPSDNYLLDEQIPLKDQPKHVQESVRRALSYMENLPEDSITEKSMRTIVGRELYGNHAAQASVYKLMHEFLADRPKSSGKWNLSPADLKSAREALDRYSVYTRATDIENGGTPPLNTLEDVEQYIDKLDKKPSQESYEIATRDVLFDMFEAAIDQIKAFSAIPHPEKAKAYNKLLAIQAGADARPLVKHMLDTIDLSDGSDRANLERAFYRYIFDPSTQNISAVEKIISSVLFKDASKNRALTKGDIDELNNITNDLVSEFEYGANKLSTIAQDGILALTGHDVQQLLYEAVAGSGNRQKDVAKILKEAGLKGYKYDGGMDGPCAVVFDNDAMKIINKFSVKTPYQKMVENITPIASDDLTAREKAIVDFAKKMGLQVQFFEGDPNLHGFHADGTNVAFLNRRSAMDLNQTFWHEAFHWMRESNPDLYNQMVKEVFGGEVSEKQLADYAVSIGRTDMSKELAIEEMLADAMWDAGKRGSFFEKLGIEHPSLCAKIIKWIKNLYEDFKAHFHNPQAGLTNTQIKRMSNTLSKIAEKLVDGDGNKLFSVDEKGNIKETAAGKRAVSDRAKVEAERDGSNQKYRVTNRNIVASDPVRIVDITDAKRIRVKDGKNTKQADALVDSLLGKTFRFIGGEGFVTERDDNAVKGIENPNIRGQIIHSHATFAKIFNDKVRGKALGKLEELLRNGVYIDKHPDSAHGTKTKYIEIFVPVRDSDGLHVFRISARERGNSASIYEIGNALFYNVKKEGDLTMLPSEGYEKTASNKSPSTITIAEMLNGIKDRNNIPYVINGKLNYDDNIFLTKNMLSGEPNTRHSVEDLKTQTLSVFPNAQNIEVHDSGVSFDLPNGSHIEVNFTDETISVDRAKAQKDYGGTLQGSEKASGKVEMVDKDALITLTMDSPDETISHEAMHLAWNLLTDRERNALLRTYGNEEGAAEGMREWKIRRKMKQGTIAGKIMQKISDMAHKLLSLFHENDQHVFQKLESGEIWERGNENNTAARNVKYKMNPLDEAEKYLKSHKNLGEKAGVYIDRTFRPDLAKAKANPNISVNEPKKKGWSAVDTALNNTVRSPSRIKSAKTNYIWGLADAAQRELQELRGKWTHSFAGAIKDLNSKEKERYTDILWEEDMKQHVFSDKELRDAGVSEKVIKAHQKTRSLLGRIYTAVNAVYTRERIENFTYKTRKKAEKARKELAKRPHTFVMHDIRETVKDGKPAFQVSIKTGGYREVHSVVTAEEMKKLDDDKDVYIKNRKQLDDGSFKVSYLAYNKPLTNMEGYMPHIFHGVLIVKKYTDADGNVKSKVVGSADTIEKAVVKADAMQKEEGGEFIIAPKEFSSEGEIENPLLLGDMDYFKLMDNLRKGASLTLDEAREMTHATMKGRHVYYGAKKHRKGAEGFEKNAIWVIQHHIDSSSRYVALDPFKQKAISFFERAFGDYDKDWTGEAAFCKGYIDSVLGKPSRLETLANDFLHLFPWFKNEARPARRMAGNLTGLTGVLKLGASLSSGFVNTLQLFNCVGYVGARKTAVGLKRALHPNAADKKILVASGVSEESGLALDSIGHITAEGTALSKVGNVINSVNNFLMKPFTLAEKTIRKATILAAYYKAIGDGLSKGEAIQYARDINRKVNFDYSVADAPRIFRALQSTVIGDMALQFQKYGVKEMEVISDFLPVLGNTTTKQKLEFFIPYLLVSGIWNAFPFEDALLSLLKLLGFDDPEKEAKRAMMEWAGNNADRKALVNVANYGAGAIVGVDISQRVGLKGVVPETSNIVTGGPLGSTTVQLAKAVLNGDTNGAMKAISPAAGNIYGAVAGYNTDSKGRKTVDYDTRDRIVRGLGFRTIKEANATDAQSIVYNYKEQKKNDRAKAKSEYLKDPSSGNRQKLKEMGYSDKEIKALKDDKKSTRVERSQVGLSKEDKKKLKPVFDYVQ